MTVGDNFDKKNDQGPQNSKMQYEKILGYIDSGKSDGATVHLGGNAVKATDGKKGYCKLFQSTCTCTGRGSLN